VALQRQRWTGGAHTKMARERVPWPCGQSQCLFAFSDWLSRYIGEISYARAISPLQINSCKHSQKSLIFCESSQMLIE
jgi:hypothetical protein